ncbi:DNA-3-methyladenine glycosylase I [Loigolactobacillus iwatensis]|uniref:DNA-3-methyladenine glycosylase I n=1 Tax=Loigolactobacillus iwatensis TaxID=1267156 RepID=UPI000F7DC720|nr:DNA-3-methyladenine glycosylase I [Loigolactobacillus iwatensis]
MTIQRCTWAEADPLLQAYHDQEWCRPTHNDRTLFELLCMETYQAGLSWLIVLRKRAAFHRYFHDYDPQAVAQMPLAEIDSAMLDPAIIRNRRKLEATVINAQSFLTIQSQQGSFASYLWQFVADQPIEHQITDAKELPAKNELSQQIAKDLKQRGFKFMGPVTTYSFIQAAGLINDHVMGCAFRQVTPRR